MKNVIAVPHLGASTPESEDNCAVMAAKQLVDFLENGNIKNSVNFPECSMPRSAAIRFAIAHKNVPSMISAFSGLFSERGINIENFINKSRKDLAFTLIDTDTDVSEDDVKKLSGMEGVLHVTIIK
jgi:D-3-phosphoglycerate dehydrogenase